MCGGKELLNDSTIAVKTRGSMGDWMEYVGERIQETLNNHTWLGLIGVKPGTM